MLTPFAKTLPIGIDISERSFKAVQLRRRGRRIVVQAIGHVEVPEGVMDEGGARNLPAAAKLIRSMLDRPLAGSFTSRNAIACLPETKTFCLQAVLPESRPSEAAVRNILEKHVPYPLENINYEWAALKKTRSETVIAATAVEQRIADNYHELLHQADITPLALEIESDAAARALIPDWHPPTETVGIIDIGAVRSNFSVHVYNAPLLSVTIPVSGIRTTAVIARALRTTPDKAESAKIVCGLDPQCAHGVIASALTKTTDSVIAKIKQALDHLAEHYPAYNRPSILLLSGGGAHTKGLPAYFSERIGIATHLGDPFQNITVPAAVSTNGLQKEYATLKKFSAETTATQDVSLRFSTAVGLALRSIYHTDH